MYFWWSMQPILYLLNPWCLLGKILCIVFLFYFQFLIILSSDDGRETGLLLFVEIVCLVMPEMFIAVVAYQRKQVPTRPSLDGLSVRTWIFRQEFSPSKEAWDHHSVGLKPNVCRRGLHLLFSCCLGDIYTMLYSSAGGRTGFCVYYLKTCTRSVF